MSEKKSKDTPLPPMVATGSEAADRSSFRIDRTHVQAYFIQRSSTLFVTFDNLGTVGEYDPPQPWLHRHMEAGGFTVLGLIAKRKDWYRNGDAPAVLEELRAVGFFDKFDRIIFVGSSMGGFAALVFAPIVPNARVLAFSPQTTLNREIAPFEERFRYGHRKWDWDDPAFLDAALNAEKLTQAWVFYDQFVAEDLAHATRLAGDDIRHIKCGHFSHRLIRQLKACGALGYVIQSIGDDTFDECVLRKMLRSRRDVRPWQKAILGNLETAGHRQLAQRAAASILQKDPTAAFANKVIKRLSAPTSSVIYHDDQDEVPFEGAITVAYHALVVPERDHDAKLASGVLLSDGSYCEMSRTWIRARKSTLVPTLVTGEIVKNLAGRHLFAGHIRGHFGHFLVESTARLWALGAFEWDIDSIIYTPFRGKVPAARTAITKLEPFFSLLGIKQPIQTFGHAVKVEELLVPELGFGWNEKYAGSVGYRRLMREVFGQNIKAEGSERLYISRARLPNARGGILGEEIVEQNLAAQGYEIFHPEQHALEVQIARYKAARQVVALDGSALHLAAFFLNKGDRVAIVLRRSSANVADYVLQYRSFCSIDPDVVNCIQRDWIPEGSKRADYRSVGELDFEVLFGALKGLNYIESSFRPILPSAAEVHHMLGRVAQQRECAFTAINEAN